MWCMIKVLYCDFHGVPSMVLRYAVVLCGFQVGTGQNLLISYHPGCVPLELIVSLVCSDVWFQ